MYFGRTLCAQVMAFVPWTSFTRIVERYASNAGARTLSCAERFRAMALAHMLALKAGALTEMTLPWPGSRP